MTDGSFDQKVWFPALGNLLTGKALSFFRELAVTEETLYLSFKTSFLERMGCTIKQARKTLWNNHPGNDTNLREHLQPILRAITRLGEHLNTKADFQLNCFKDVYQITTLRMQSTTCVIVIRRTRFRWWRNYNPCGNRSRHWSVAGYTS